MKNSFDLLRHYPLSCLCVVVIWVLCLIPIPETPLDNVPLIDKWTHFVMYGGLCLVIWGEYGHRHASLNMRKALLWAMAAPIVMGGLIEIAQATCTGGTRSGEFNDWVADIVGVVLGQLIGIPLARALARRNRG